MKKIVSLAVLSLAMLPVAAQDTYENARLLGSDLNGTARYVGMGGAMDALGGDISTMGTNPAGIGMFRHSMVTGSLSVLNQQGVKRFDEVGKTNLSLDQAGFVYSFKEDFDDSYVNIGFNVHKSRNFNQILSATNKLRGASLSKLAYGKSTLGSDLKGGYYLKEDANGFVEGWCNKTSPYRAYTYTQWDLLYTNGLTWDNQNLPLEDDPSVSPYYNPNAIYFNNIFFEGTDYGFDRAHNGWITDFDFNISGNINNRLFLGATIGIRSVDYKGYSEYQEFLIDANDRPIGNTVLADERRITGNGVNIKAGAIWRPFEDSPFRIGLSIETPTWYELKSKNATLLINATDYHAVNPTFNNWGWDEYSSGETYEYRYYTPWKFGLSLGHTVGDFLALGAGLDYTDYGTADNRINDGYDAQGYPDSYSDAVMNLHTENTLKGTATLKLGAELKPIPEFAVRLGYNYVSPMYRKNAFRDTGLNSMGNWYSSTPDYTNWDATHRITCGLGYRYENWNFDVAYQYNTTKGTYHPFQDMEFDDIIRDDQGQLRHEVNIATPTDVKFDRHQLLFTVGYNF